MAVALRQSRSFDSDSPVTRYWLANCVGFSVTGGGRGTVEEVLTEDDPHEPEMLVVRSGRHRVRQLPTSSVVAVVPSDRVLVVEQSPNALPARTRRAARMAGHGGIVGARLLALLALATWELTRRGVVRASPHVVRGARAGGTRTVRLVRSVPLQRYALSARSAMTKRPQGRSPGS